MAIHAIQKKEITVFQQAARILSVSESTRRARLCGVLSRVERRENSRKYVMKESWKLIFQDRNVDISRNGAKSLLIQHLD